MANVTQKLPEKIEFVKKHINLLLDVKEGVYGAKSRLAELAIEELDYSPNICATDICKVLEDVRIREGL